MFDKPSLTAFRPAFLLSIALLALIFDSRSQPTKADPPFYSHRIILRGCWSPGRELGDEREHGSWLRIGSGATVRGQEQFHVIRASISSMRPKVSLSLRLFNFGQGFYSRLLLVSSIPLWLALYYARGLYQKCFICSRRYDSEEPADNSAGHDISISTTHRQCLGSRQQLLVRCWF